MNADAAVRPPPALAAAAQSAPCVDALEVRWHWLRWDELARDDLYDALALRCQAFIVEQVAYQDLDGFDRHAWHLLGRAGDGQLHAYLRAIDPGRKYAEPSIGRVVTSPERRGTGLGWRLMREGLARSTAVWPGAAIRIGAQARLERFYGELGFARCGDDYLEDGIAHVEMLRPPS